MKYVKIKSSLCVGRKHSESCTVTKTVSRLLLHNIRSVDDRRSLRRNERRVCKLMNDVRLKLALLLMLHIHAHISKACQFPLRMKIFFSLELLALGLKVSLFSIEFYNFLDFFQLFLNKLQ